MSDDAETDRQYSNSVLHWHRRASAAEAEVHRLTAEVERLTTRNTYRVAPRFRFGMEPIARSIMAEEALAERETDLAVAQAALAAERARTAALAEAGTELALWLQDWIDAHPGTTWCYSETALETWRALICRPIAVREG